MRIFSLLALSLLALVAQAATPALAIINEAGMSAGAIAKLNSDYAHWAQRVNAYNHVNQPSPVSIVIANEAGPGLYVEDTIYLPPKSSASMLETFVHEYAHHATGHDSSFFFKEGIATSTLEALFLQDGKMPQNWPQYGQRNDAWVRLYMAKNQLPALQQFISSEGFDNRSADADFRAWQTYVVGGSFVSWLIRTEGYVRFRKAFDAEDLGADAADLERRWLASIKAQPLPDFDVAEALPSGARYQRYAQRLGR